MNPATEIPCLKQIPVTSLNATMVVIGIHFEFGIWILEFYAVSVPRFSATSTMMWLVRR